jgi:outer membrane protein assembly factor BamB
MLLSRSILSATLLTAAASAAPQGPTDHLIVHVQDSTGVAPSISRFTDDGTLNFSTGMSAPVEYHRVAFTDDGGFVTAAENPSRIVVFSADGVEVNSFPTPELQATAFAIEVLANGEIAVSDGAVHYYSADGVFRMTDSSWPALFLQEDRDGGLWVGAPGGGFSANYIRLDPNGGAPLGAFSVPFGLDLAAAPDGTLWLATGPPFLRIENRTRTGGLISSFSTQAPAWALEIASDGTLWASEFDGDRVVHYATDGTVLGSISLPVGAEGQILSLDVGRADTLGDTLCPGEPNSVGEGARVRSSGSLSVQDNELILDVTGLPALSAGYFLMSDATGQLPVSQGVLCLGAPVLRFSLHPLQSSPGSWAQFRPDLTNLPQGTTIGSGSTWHFQYWYRDANPRSVSNFSDAVSVTFL